MRRKTYKVQTHAEIELVDAIVDWDEPVQSSTGEQVTYVRRVLDIMDESENMRVDGQLSTGHGATNQAPLLEADLGWL
ncbi:hypothetical protein NPIL_87031 [Nephila pilipes]|uniref:Uncharacterized protein n=1 Tax=Nephila pilipes TaxID=299642 RepID=A0A8X6N8F5_NEPPI|nr:hypothetical protein NPIL_87031 [Nephila pilipes]